MNLLVPWITRDLRVLTGDEDASILTHYILGLLQTVDLQSDHGLSLLLPFLHEKSELFVHELFSFARSPCNIESYDVSVQY